MGNEPPRLGRGAVKRPLGCSCVFLRKQPPDDSDRDDGNDDAGLNQWPFFVMQMDTLEMVLAKVKVKMCFSL